MLTIRHVEKGKLPTVFEAVNIHRTPAGQLAFGRETIITTGKIYVMNDSGHTVAVYDFDKQEEGAGQ